jgi:hypothetical protein
LRFRLATVGSSGQRGRSTGCRPDQRVRRGESSLKPGATLREGLGGSTDRAVSSSKTCATPLGSIARVQAHGCNVTGVVTGVVTLSDLNRGV